MKPSMASSNPHRGGVFLVVESDKGIAFPSVVGVNNSAIPWTSISHIEWQLNSPVQISFLRYIVASK